MQCNHKIQLKNGNIVPCGKCYACLANQRQEWVFRLQQECLDSVFSIFVTLTYNDEHVPLDMSVNKRDVQLFNKRLRKHFPPGDLRFYVVSEYGDHTFRPHYHGLYFFKRNYDRKFIYDIFEKSWALGFIKFGDVEEGSIVYCTKYCLKHNSTPPGRKPTFRLMSKMNGGLGYKYLTKMSNFHIENDVYNFVSHGGKKCRMPRYYKDRLILPFKHLQQDAYAEYLENFRMQTYEENAKAFSEFLKTHKGLSFDEAVTHFNEKQMQKSIRQEDLILRHCKKQKM